jgi:acyl-CoA synthetase (AMP-forming)/AMP-acid ligase II/aryl carrier-like protein
VQQIYAQETVDKVFNLYGPTEATTYSTFALMQKGQHDPITIGRPIRATEVYILDDHLQPVPIGVPGQLYLGGVGLARGYVQRPELTDEKFIAHPFSVEPDARLYKTGDLARYLPDGHIEYLGRMDHQVKMRGFRIEPGEIEAVLLQHPAIRNAVVIAREDTPGTKYLAAYLVTDKVQQVTIGELRRTLHLHLPDYMVPAYYMMLDKLPLNAHGKVDRQALPSPDRTQSVVKAAYVAPRTPGEQQLASLWAALLAIEEVGIHDNFFELGGHSILGMAMIAWARDHGLELTIKQLFQTPTIAALAQAGG